MVKGILADIHMKGPVADLARAMQGASWAEFWNHLDLTLFAFEDVNLTATSTDKEIWHKCQEEQLILITNNRNQDSPDSLEATIRRYNTPKSLPVFTISDLDRFRKNRAYAERVLEQQFPVALKST
ncbi:MAG: hypothetical protein ACREHD_34065 [Pirellulales bacterium]